MPSTESRVKFNWILLKTRSVWDFGISLLKFKEYFEDIAEQNILLVVWQQFHLCGKGFPLVLLWLMCIEGRVWFRLLFYVPVFFILFLRIWYMGWILMRNFVTWISHTHISCRSAINQGYTFPFNILIFEFQRNMIFSSKTLRKLIIVLGSFFILSVNQFK